MSIVFWHFAALAKEHVLTVEEVQNALIENTNKVYCVVYEIRVRTVYRNMAALNEMEISLYVEERRL